MKTKQLLTACTLSVSLIGCGGGGGGSDTPAPAVNTQTQQTTQPADELLFILETDTSAPIASVVNGQLETNVRYNVLFVDPSKETDNVSKFNNQLFSQYYSQPYLPTAPNEWANAIVWIEGNKIYGADSHTAQPYLIAENDVITETCNITIEVLFFDGSANNIILETAGPDQMCGSGGANTDNTSFLIPHKTSKQDLEAVSGDKLKGLTGKGLDSDTFKSYSHFIDDNDKFAIYDVTKNTVIARYELADRIEDDLYYNDKLYAIIDNTLYIAPYANLIDGSYSFTGGLDIGAGPHSVYRSLDGDIYIQTPDKVYELNQSNNSLEEFLTIDFNAKIAAINDGKAIIIERHDNNLSYMQELDIESGALTQIMSSSAKMFGAVNYNNKIFINDGESTEQSDAKIYDIKTSQLETIDDAMWYYHGLGLSGVENGIMLMKHRSFDGEKNIPGTVSVYDTNTGKELFSYGEFNEPLLYVGWYHQNYQLAIDHDRFRLYLIDLDQAESLEMVYESDGVLSKLF